MNGVAKKRIEDLQKLLVLNRIKILDLLYKEDTCVCQMVEKLDMKHNLISHHLKTLLDMSYIKSCRNGQHIIYNLIEEKKEIIGELLTLVNK
jgi:ArsR family transcriptional regulator